MKRSFLCSILYSVDRSKGGKAPTAPAEQERRNFHMDYNNYNRGYAEPAMTSADYMSRTYRWMAGGLLVTFAMAYITATTSLIYLVNSLYFLLTIGELALVFMLSARVQKMSIDGARAAGTATDQSDRAEQQYGRKNQSCKFRLHNVLRYFFAHMRISCNLDYVLPR